MKKNSLFVFLMFGTILFFTACKNDKATVKETVETETTEESTGLALTEEGNWEGENYKFVPESGQINWIATKVGGKHNGVLIIKDGFLKMQDGKISGGSFLIDMEKIVVLDQQGEWKDKLERHLKGSDEGKEDHFFNVAKYPTAKFDINKVTLLEGNESANHMVYGDLTLKGITKPVSMTVNVMNENDNVKVQSLPFRIDRTEWGVNYNSKKIFADLQDNIINDEITLQIGFTASK